MVNSQEYVKLLHILLSSHKWQHVDTQDGGPKEVRLIVSTCVGRADILFANQDAHDPTAEHQDVIPHVSKDGPDATPDVILDANKENLAAIREEDPVSTKAGDARDSLRMDSGST